jgi:hypothetical protein
MPTSNARIGYENLLENGTVVASSEDADYPVENCYDWLTSDFFKPAASGTINIDLTLSGSDSADYFAFFAHDLYSHGGTIKLQYWNGSSYVNCFSAVTPTDNKPTFITFASQTSTKWRVVITCTSVFSIGVITFGAQLALEYGMYIGWTPAPFGRDPQLVTSKADGGGFLGRSRISNGVKTSLVLQGATDAWMRSNWLAFVEAAEQRAFFFVPDITNHATECVYCWVESSIPAPTHTNYGFMGVTIPLRGLVE